MIQNIMAHIIILIFKHFGRSKSKKAKYTQLDSNMSSAGMMILFYIH